MLCLKETIIGLCICWKCGMCACKMGCVPVEYFPIEEMDQSLVKVVVSTLESS
jgi:hypothetical protein